MAPPTLAAGGLGALQVVSLPGIPLFFVHMPDQQAESGQVGIEANLLAVFDQEIFARSQLWRLELYNLPRRCSHRKKGLCKHVAIQYQGRLEAHHNA